MSFDDTFDPTALTRTDTVNSASSLKLNTAVSRVKTATNFPRIDLEQLYGDLKDAIGHRWDVYFDAVTRFARGAYVTIPRFVH